jgi:hypothetical protein
MCTCAQQKVYRKNAAQPHRSGTKFEILTESVSACWKSDPQTVFRGVALGQHVKKKAFQKNIANYPSVSLQARILSCFAGFPRVAN